MRCYGRKPVSMTKKNSSFMMPTELLRNRKDGAPASSLRMYDGDGLLEPQDKYVLQESAPE